MHSNEELKRINSTSHFEQRKIKYSYQENYPEVKAIAEKLKEKMKLEGLGLKKVSKQTKLRPSEIDQFLKGANLGEEKHLILQKFLESKPPTYSSDMWEIFGEEYDENVEQCPFCLAWGHKGLLDHLCF